MLQNLRIGQSRSYFDTQHLDFCRPNGAPGSGYNVLVGKNNSGKSTLLKLIRDLASSEQRMTIGQEARHDPDRPIAQIEWLVIGDSGKTAVSDISIDTSGTGGLFQKTGQAAISQDSFRYIPSRRPFISEFNASTSLNAGAYEHNDFLNRRSNQGYFDSNLANLIASLPLNSEKGTCFLELLRKIDPRITNINADNISGRDVLRFQSASGRWHPISDTGDGLINSIRISYSLSTSAANSCIVIDEPELSLHPQLQKNLYNLLIEHSGTKQILVVTHSPHFIAWKDICRNGRLIRLFLDDKGASQIRTAKRETLRAIERHAHGNITSRKYFDTVCKELFFSDEAVLVEGPDDVQYISNYLETLDQSALPLMGYGCGGAGNISSWIDLCVELGIKCAALYDGDKRDLFESQLALRSDRQEEIALYLLRRDDIRDKYKRDERGRETDVIHAKGIFQRNGAIRKAEKQTFDILIGSIRSFINVP